MNNKDRIDRPEIMHDEHLRNIIQSFPDQGMINLLLKDVHMIEAAFATEKRIISTDDKARKHFGLQILESYNKLREILWVNPEKPEEKCVEWLENGAETDSKYKLENFNNRINAKRTKNYPRH